MVKCVDIVKMKQSIMSTNNLCGTYHAKETPFTVQFLSAELMVMTLSSIKLGVTVTTGADLRR